MRKVARSADSMLPAAKRAMTNADSYFGRMTESTT
jgi:hypothetical protein